MADECDGAVYVARGGGDGLHEEALFVQGEDAPRFVGVGFAGYCDYVEVEGVRLLYAGVVLEKLKSLINQYHRHFELVKHSRPTVHINQVCHVIVTIDLSAVKVTYN